MLKTICYISDSINEETIESLDTIFNKTIENNIKKGITGILIYNDRNFFQILEGSPEAVDDLFKRISRDTRHKNIFNIINIDIEQRIFEGYSFGFTTINNYTELKKLNEYLKWLKKAEHVLTTNIIVLVESFIRNKTIIKL